MGCSPAMVLLLLGDRFPGPERTRTGRSSCGSQLVRTPRSSAGKSASVRNVLLQRLLLWLVNAITAGSSARTETIYLQKGGVLVELVRLRLPPPDGCLSAFCQARLT